MEQVHNLKAGGFNITPPPVPETYGKVFAYQVATPKPAPSLPAFFQCVPGANGEQLLCWPGAQEGQGLSSSPPAELSHGPNAPFIDRQIDKQVMAVAFPASLLSTLLGCRDPHKLNGSKQALPALPAASGWTRGG